jgi:ribonuclease G
MNENTECLVIDSKPHYEGVTGFLSAFAPQLLSRVEYYESRLPLFEKYGLEHEIEKALMRKVWLPCGGYFIIEKTEALTAIDVNTGKFVGKSNLEETVFQTNVEAVKEIARQIRLRDIGGIIVLDLIDMTDETHKTEVYEALLDAVKQDRSRIKILPINEFGLIQLTRKRVRKGLLGTLCQPCPYCGGEGRVLSADIVYSKTRKKIKKLCETTEKNTITVCAHPMVASMLIGDDEENIYRLEEETGKKIQVRANENYHIEQFNIITV